MYYSTDINSWTSAFTHSELGASLRVSASLSVSSREYNLTSWTCFSRFHTSLSRPLLCSCLRVFVNTLTNVLDSKVLNILTNNIFLVQKC